MDEVKPKMAAASQFIVQVFRSGNATRLVMSALKLAFAESVNFLWATLRASIAAAGQYIVEWFRTAITYFEILTTADFWKGMGNALIGVFLGAIGFLQKGLAEAIEIARPLADLFGKGDKLDSAQSSLRQSAKILNEEAAERFGKATDLLGPAAEKIAQRMNEAGRNITSRFTKTFNETPEVIKTAGFREGFVGLVEDIKKSIPEAKERVIPVVVQQDEEEKEEPPAEPKSQPLSPIVTSLGRVGGGGYSTGALDAQRENNKLTSETNRILREMSERMKPGGGQLTASFG
jgi:hypothetical protein